MPLIRYEDVVKNKKDGKDPLFIDMEILAMALHEAGREAVETGATVAAEKFGEQTRKFLCWEEITENARDGRHIQARYLLQKFYVIGK
jgi:hypothetical protein